MKIHISKNYLLNTAISTVLLTSFALSMEEEKTLYTPTKVFQDQTNQWTPGEQVTKKQAEILTKTRFKEVLGEDTVDKIGVDWSIFLNQTPFDEPSKRNTLRIIKNFLYKQLKDKRDDTAFNTLYGEILILDQEYKQVHQERLEKITESYFKEAFPESKIEFGAKSGGVQLGSKAIVTPEGQNSITYYIKTHSSGLKSGDSSGAKILDPKELMVYKILEGFNIGCETRFLGRDLSNFYIATKDANSEGNFSTYDDLSKKEGILKQVREGFSKREIPSEGFLKNPTEDFIKGMISLDLLSRILRLTDLQTNPENFGFVEKEGSYRVKVIDFRIQGDAIFNVTEDHFKGLLAGNGSVTYHDSAMYFLFKKWNGKERILMTKNIFEESFFNFEDKIKNSAEQVIKAITSLSEKKQIDLKPQAGILEEQLLEYNNAITDNFKFFKEKLEGYSM